MTGEIFGVSISVLSVSKDVLLLCFEGFWIHNDFSFVGIFYRCIVELKEDRGDGRHCDRFLFRYNHFSLPDSIFEIFPSRQFSIVDHRLPLIFATLTGIFIEFFFSSSQKV